MVEWDPLTKRAPGTRSTLRSASGKDKAGSSDLEEDRRALGDGNVPDESEVAGQWILEHDRILSLDDKAGYVEGSEAGELVPERWIVSIANSAKWEVSDELVVNEDGQLANTVVAVVNVKALEGQDHRLTGYDASHRY